MAKLRASILLALLAAGVFAAASGSALARQQLSGGFVPGVVEPPPPGVVFHDTVVSGAPQALSAAAADRRELAAPDGSVVIVETSPGYVPNPQYDEELVAFLGSLLHGSELGGLTVYVAVPSEIKGICGAVAAACYDARRGRMNIVGQEFYGGISTSYAVTHEYGHRIADYRHNPPFPGGAPAWGTKRWGSVKHVCQGALAGKYAPGDEGRFYFRNPGEAFAESYAWLHVGSGFTEWRWAGTLRPNPAAFAAIRSDVLDPWRPVRFERRGRLTFGRQWHIYRLRPKYDGWLQVRSHGGGDLDLGLLDKRGHFLEISARPGTSRERLNFLVCGERKLFLLVEAFRPPGSYRLEIKTP
jgi:hypothetical protein